MRTQRVLKVFLASAFLILPTLVFRPRHILAQDSAPAEKWAFLIALDQYQDLPRPRLRVDHAGRIANLLWEKFHFTKVVELYDGDATRAEIIKLLRSLGEARAANAGILVYFNGYSSATPEGDEVDWYGFDSESRTEAVPSDLVQTVLRSIRARHVLVLSGAGFSARVLSSGGGVDPNLRSRQAIAYTPQVESASDPFGKALVSILEGLGEGESLNGSELAQRLAREVGEDAILSGVIRNTGDEGGTFPLSSEKVEEGVLLGVLKDAESGSPLPGLSVGIQGIDRKGRTGASGEFRLWAPPGVYSALVVEGSAPGEVLVLPLDFEVHPGEELPLGPLEVAFAPSPEPPAPTPTATPTPIPAPEVKAAVSEAPPESSESVRAKEIAFESVTLSARGQPRETKPGSARVFIEDLGGGIGMELIEIPAGTYTRGSEQTEEGHRPYEEPAQTVHVPSFYLGRFEVTQDQWGAVAELPMVERSMDPDPSYFKGGERPVERISWEDAVEFCARLSKHTGRAYRLPSEAEWEYACRAGTTSPFHFGPTLSPEYANYFSSDPYGSGPTGPSPRATVEVGHFGSANPFGLHQMHGNVAEWCADLWHETYEDAPGDGTVWEVGGDRFRRVMRGGSWRNFPTDLRSAARKGLSWNLGNNTQGFRVALTKP